MELAINKNEILHFSSTQAFTDMQVNKIETQKKLKMLEIQAEMLKTSKKKYDLTDKEISNMSPDTRFVSPHFILFHKNSNA